MGPLRDDHEVAGAGSARGLLQHGACAMSCNTRESSSGGPHASGRRTRRPSRGLLEHRLLGDCPASASSARSSGGASGRLTLADSCKVGAAAGGAPAVRRAGRTGEATARGSIGGSHDDGDGTTRGAAAAAERPNRLRMGVRVKREEPV